MDQVWDDVDVERQLIDICVGLRAKSMLSQRGLVWSAVVKIMRTLIKIAEITPSQVADR